MNRREWNDFWRRRHEMAAEAARRADIRNRLAACHGAERASLILAGRDPETNADIARWRNLGRVA